MQRCSGMVVAIAVIAGCMPAAAGRTFDFGPSRAMQPRVQSATQLSWGDYLVRVQLPQPAYVIAVSVNPNRSASVLRGPAFELGTSRVDAGPQALTFHASGAITRTAAEWTPSDGYQCNANPDRARCASPPYYLVFVASETPFDADAVKGQLADVELRGADTAVVHRVALALSPNADAQWAGTARLVEYH